MYKLTYPEIARLYRGWRATEEARAEEQEQRTAEATGKPVSPNGKTATRPRDSDYRMIERFQEQHLN
jgi:hypothetical protein